MVHAWHPRSVLHSLVTLLLLPLHTAIATKLSIVIAPSRTVLRGQRVQVSCYIDDMAKISMASFSLYLFCPIFNSRVSCFQNCHNSCADVSRCPQRAALNAFTCARYASGRSLTYEYTLARAEERHSGNYRCSFYGLSSKTLKLNVLDPALLRRVETVAPKVKPPTKWPPKPKPKPKPRTTRRPAPTVNNRSRPRKPDKMVTEAPVGSVKRDGTASGADPSETEDGHREPPRYGRGVKGLVQMGEKLLFVVILLFIVSLVINSVFCIRCILIYFYGSNMWRKVKMGSVLCMNEEIRVIREMKGDNGLVFPSLSSAFSKSPSVPQSAAPLLTNPAVIRRQHSADPPHPQLPYRQYQMQGRPRPRSQQSVQDDGTGPRVMRVVSEIELQPGETLDEQTVMYVPLPVVVQRNGSVPSGNATSRRPLSVVFQPGQEGHLVTSRPRLSTSVSGIDRLRRSSQEMPHRMLSIESVFEMETLHE